MFDAVKGQEEIGFKKKLTGKDIIRVQIKGLASDWENCIFFSDISGHLDTFQWGRYHLSAQIDSGINN